MAAKRGCIATTFATFAVVAVVLSTGACFVQSPALRRVQQTSLPSKHAEKNLRASLQADVKLPEVAKATSTSESTLVVGSWTLAALTATIASRSRTLARRAEADEEAEKEAKKPFDVFDPSTYGSISMDDVTKYGAAGTLAYVLTELGFWALALPAECATFYYTAGRWPDFANDVDKAAVFGFVFAASNLARLCLPLRFGAALAMAPWVDENVMQRFGGEDAKSG